MCDAAPFLFSDTTSLLFLATKAISVMTSFRKQSCFLPAYEIKSSCIDPGPASTSPSVRQEKQRLHSLPTSPSRRFASIAKWGGMGIVTPETNILGGFSQLKEFGFCMELAFLLPSFIYCVCGFTLVANAQRVCWPQTFSDNSSIVHCPGGVCC